MYKTSIYTFSLYIFISIKNYHQKHLEIIYLYKIRCSIPRWGDIPVFNFFYNFSDFLLGYWIEWGSIVLYQLPPKCGICKSIGDYDNAPEDMLNLIRVYLDSKSMLRPHYSLHSIVTADNLRTQLIMMKFLINFLLSKTSSIHPINLKLL